MTVPKDDPCSHVDPSLLRAFDGLRATLMGWRRQTWQHPHHERPHHAIVALADLDQLVRRLDATIEIARFGGVTKQAPHDVGAVMSARSREASAGEGYERRRYMASYDTVAHAACEAFRGRGRTLFADVRVADRLISFVATATPQVKRFVNETSPRRVIPLGVVGAAPSRAARRAKPRVSASSTAERDR